MQRKIVIIYSWFVYACSGADERQNRRGDAAREHILNYF